MTKVMYMVGKGRSGSTVIANVLGQVPGVVSVGELLLLYPRGMVGGFKCGCGLQITNCPFWGNVTDAAFADIGKPDPTEVVRLQQQLLRWPNVPRLLAQKQDSISSWPALSELVDVMSRLYRGIAEVSEARVIVDSSKWPAAPTPLGIVPGIDHRILHLVRDPRAVVHSWQRKKAQADSRRVEDMPRYSVLYSMTSYWARNLAAEFIMARSDSTLRVRYEDFTRRPRTVLTELLDFVGERPDDPPIAEDGSIAMRLTHTAGGNPNRLEAGRIVIRPDEQWQHEMPTAQRWAASALGLPWLLRYRYPIG